MYTEVDFANSLLLHPPHSNCFLLSLLTPFSPNSFLPSSPPFVHTFFVFVLPFFSPHFPLLHYLLWLSDFPSIISPLLVHYLIPLFPPISPVYFLSFVSPFVLLEWWEAVFDTRERGGGGGGLRRGNEKREREPDGGKRMKIK